MRENGISSDRQAAKEKKYPIKHKRPKGQIIERGPRRFMVWLHSHSDVTGKPIRYTKTFKTLKEADVHLSEKVAEKNKGQVIFDTTQPLVRLIHWYLTEVHAPNVKPQSHQLTKYYLNTYVVPVIGHRRVRSLTSGDFNVFYNTLRENGVGGKPLSNCSIKKIHVWLNGIFKDAMMRGALSKNPLDGVSPGLVQHKEIQYLTAEQTRLFLDTWESYQVETSRHFSKHNLGPLWHFGFETGVRPEELMGIRKIDLNLNPATVLGRIVPPFVFIRQVAVRNVRLKGWHFDHHLKTSKSRRLIFISRKLAQALEEHLIMIEEMRKRAGEKWRELGLVFPNTKGEPLYDYRLRKLFKAIIEKMGLDPVPYSLYCMRHTMATLLLIRNVNPKVAQERLGHSAIKVTLDTYSHVIPSLQMEATDIITEAIFPNEVRPELSYLDLTSPLSEAISGSGLALNPAPETALIDVKALDDGLQV